MRNSKHIDQDYDKSDLHKLKNKFDSLNLPPNKPLLVHVRIKSLREDPDITTRSYSALSKLLIDVLHELFHPETIIVPTFTYSFTKSGVYHRKYSHSEVGRFSEEVRENFANYRSPDPIFSVVETSNLLSNHESEIDYTVAFGKSSLNEFLIKNDCYIINIGINDLTLSILHHIEKLADVHYRYMKLFYGICYNDEDTYESISYRYFVRDLDLNPKWDRQKLEHDLLQDCSMQLYNAGQLKYSALSSQELIDYVLPKLQSDQNYLLMKK